MAQIGAVVFAVALVVVGIEWADWFTKRQELEVTKGKLEVTLEELGKAKADARTAHTRIDMLERELRQAPTPPVVQPPKKRSPAPR